jgi:hypothetical protein
MSSDDLYEASYSAAPLTATWSSGETLDDYAIACALAEGEDAPDTTWDHALALQAQEDEVDSYCKLLLQLLP